MLRRNGFFHYPDFLADRGVSYDPIVFETEDSLVPYIQSSGDMAGEDIFRTLRPNQNGNIDVTIGLEVVLGALGKVLPFAPWAQLIRYPSNETWVYATHLPANVLGTDYFKRRSLGFAIEQ